MVDQIPNLFRKYVPAAPPAPVPAPVGTGYPAAFQDVAPPPSQVVNENEPILVAQNPLRTFLGDIAIPAAATPTIIDVYGQMGSGCVGFVLIPLGTGVMFSANGGGFRTVNSTLVVDESIINTLSVIGGASGAILQLNGS